MLLFIILLFPAFSFQDSGASVNEGKSCRISVMVNSHQPIILNSKGEFLYPKVPYQRILEIQVNETIQVACPGTQLPNGAQFENAVCIANTSFEVNGTVVDLSNINCVSKVKGVARYTNNSCEMMGKEIEIGFEMPELFLRMIQICFDSESYNSLYSHANLSRYIADHERTSSPNFKQDNFYNIQSVNSLFKRPNQRATINQLLGLSENDTTYIKDDSDFFFGRGHLTPKSDFVYDFQEDITFHLVNAAPQWEIFNAGNWEQIEGSVRKLAQNRNLDLSTYTGTLGISTLPNIAGDEIPMYLYVEDDQRELPVPEFYWKVVLHQETETAVAIVGLNNPFIADSSPYQICEDVSSKLTWLKYERDNLTKGFIHACEVNEFRKLVPQLPLFTVSGLLV